MKKYLILAVFSIIFICSCSKEKQESSTIPVIDIEQGLQRLKIRKLSDFAKKLRYVRLETNENCLIGERINKIFLEKDKIIIEDGAPYLKVFDAYTGKYLYNIGSKGQGVGELPRLWNADVNPQKNIVLLSWSDLTNQFNMEGKFFKSVSYLILPKEKERVARNRTAIDTNLYVAGIEHWGENQQIMTIIYDDNENIIDTTKCYENLVNSDGSCYDVYMQTGQFYRTPNNNLRYYRGLSDTIYSYHSKKHTFLPAFYIAYEKHKTSRGTTRHEENKDWIYIFNICESERYFFLDCEMKNGAPEPFEDEIFRGGSIRQFINKTIWGIFDKETATLEFLLQPIPTIKGLQNDIDNGLPFLVNAVSSKGELIDYYQAYKFLDHAKKLENPSESFQNIVKEVKEEDNPIVIIAE